MEEPRVGELCRIFRTAYDNLLDHKRTKVLIPGYFNWDEKEPSSRNVHLGDYVIYLGTRVVYDGIVLKEVLHSTGVLSVNCELLKVETKCQPHQT